MRARHYGWNGHVFNFYEGNEVIEQISGEHEAREKAIEILERGYPHGDDFEAVIWLMQYCHRIS